ncbi:MAG: hypothetical protein QNK23_12275 [Crocinitomicaceae bacterium]|nr:hypothetical protein [Crocinitomicaceae bacterium]
MKHTDHLSKIVSFNGVPHFNESAFRTMMNVIFMEGAIHSLEEAKSKDSNPETKGKNDALLLAYKHKLEAFTWELAPNELMERIMDNSAESI